PSTTQNATRDAKPGAGGTFQVLVQNDSNVTDTFVIHGTEGIRDFTVKYQYQKLDVTRAVVAGTYRVTLAPGKSITLSLAYTIKATVKKGAGKPFYVTAAS